MRSGILRALVMTLVAVAVAQAVVLAMRGDSLRRNLAVPTTGSDLSAALAMDADSEERSLIADGPVLILVFDPGCIHTHGVATLWRDWLRNAVVNYRVVALSAAPRSAATAYASNEGWPVSVLTVRADDPGNPSRALVSRTPWVVALDVHGRVVAEGHGSRVSEVARALRSSSSWPARHPKSLTPLDTGRNHA